jgi:kumamolisin
LLKKKELMSDTTETIPKSKPVVVTKAEQLKTVQPVEIVAPVAVSEVPKSVPPVATAPKVDAPKSVEPVAALPKVEIPKAVVPVAAALKVETLKAVAPIAAAPKVEAPKAVAPVAAAPKVEAPKAVAVVSKVYAPKAVEPVAVPPKVEAPKAVAPVAAAPKVDAPKAVQPVAVAPKVEAPKSVEPVAAVPKVEALKAVAPVAAAPKVEAPKSVEPVAVAPKVDAPKSVEPVAVAPKVEAPKSVEPVAVAPKVEAPKSVEPVAVAPKVEAPKSVEPVAVAPKVDAPKSVEPVAVAPKVEAPKSVEPVAVAPKVEAPKAVPPVADAPKVEAPKAVAPVAAAPKVDAPKSVEPVAVPPQVVAPVAAAPKAVAPVAAASKVDAPKAVAPVAVAPKVDATKTLAVASKADAPRVPANLPTQSSLDGPEEKLVGDLNPATVLRTTWVLDKITRPSRVALLKSVCIENGLKWEMKSKSFVQVEGTAKNMCLVLGCKLLEYAYPDRAKGFRATGLKLPANVQHILGLDTCAKSAQHTYLCRPKDAQPRAGAFFTPLEVAQIYQFPDGSGATQKIGIIELGGGYELSDIKTNLENLGVSTASLSVTAVSVDGAANTPGDNNESVEVTLDVAIIAALCPAAEIRVYFAPNTDVSFINAVHQAGITDECDVISISWGAREDLWSDANKTVFNTLLQTLATAGKTTVFAAAGDTGSSDSGSGTNVDFPASSPYVVGCGGTSLTVTGNSIDSEVVWNNNPTTSATGGGLSKFFDVPSYQSDNSSYPFEGKRGVPDVTGSANPEKGYLIYMASQGGNIVVGGTSCVSPLWSGLTARINQTLKAASKANVGFIHPVIYKATTTAFNDILVGNNGAYTAVKDWDACSGNGSPIGTKVLDLFLNPSATVVAAFTATPTAGDTPLNVQLTDKSTGTPVTWVWEFGDGSTNSTEQNPVHQYVNTVVGTSKEYTTTLTVTNLIDEKSSVSHPITITNPNPDAGSSFPWWAGLIIGLAVLVLLVLVVWWLAANGKFADNQTSYSRRSSSVEMR